MDEHDKSEEQVEDLDTPESEAEEVKGGFSWGVSQGIKGELVGEKQTPGAYKISPSRLQGLDGNTNQHNEILVVI